MTFDPTITSGSVLNAIVLLVGFVIAFTRIGGRIDLLSQRLKAVEEVLKEHRDNDTRIAILEVRVTNHGNMITAAQQEVADLRRGKGFIAAHRDSVDGEYK